jgi:hypothetical protein
MTLPTPVKANWVSGEVVTPTQINSFGSAINTVQASGSLLAYTNIAPSVSAKQANIVASGSVVGNTFNNWIHAFAHCEINQGGSSTIINQLTFEVSGGTETVVSESTSTNPTASPNMIFPHSLEKFVNSSDTTLWVSGQEVTIRLRSSNIPQNRYQFSILGR